MSEIKDSGAFLKSTVSLPEGLLEAYRHAPPPVEDAIDTDDVLLSQLTYPVAEYAQVFSSSLGELEAVLKDPLQLIGNETGLASFDLMSRGLGNPMNKGEVVQVSAPAGHGKTLFSQTLVAHSLREGFPCAYVSFEETAAEVMQAVMLILKSIQENELPRNELGEHVFEAWEPLELASLLHLVDGKNAKDFVQVERVLSLLSERLKHNGKPLQYIVIDNYTSVKNQFVWAQKGDDSFMRAEHRVFFAIRDLAMKLQVPIILINHVSKTGMASKDGMAGGAGSFVVQAAPDQEYSLRSYVQQSKDATLPQNGTLYLYISCRKRRLVPVKNRNLFFRSINRGALRVIDRSSIDPEILQRMDVELTREEHNAIKIEEKRANAELNAQLKSEKEEPRQLSAGAWYE